LQKYQKKTRHDILIIMIGDPIYHNKFFSSIKDFYEFLGKFENITIPKITIPNEAEKTLPTDKQQLEEQSENIPNKKKEIFGSSDAEKAENKLNYEPKIKKLNINIPCFM